MIRFQTKNEIEYLQKFDNEKRRKNKNRNFAGRY